MLADTDEFTFRFRSDGSFTLFLDYNASGEAKGFADVGYNGTFSIDQTQRRLRFDVISSGATLDTHGNFDGRDIFNFGGQGSDLNALIGGPALTGVFEIGLERQ